MQQNYIIIHLDQTIIISHTQRSENQRLSAAKKGIFNPLIDSTQLDSISVVCASAHVARHLLTLLCALPQLFNNRILILLLLGQLAKERVRVQVPIHPLEKVSH